MGGGLWPVYSPIFPADMPALRLRLPLASPPASARAPTPARAPRPPPVLAPAVVPRRPPRPSLGVVRSLKADNGLGERSDWRVDAMRDAVLRYFAAFSGKVREGEGGGERG